MGFSLFSNGNKINYGIKNYIADTLNDLNKIPYSVPGSMVFVIENSTYYILNNKNKWIIKKSTGNNNEGIQLEESIALTDPSITYDVTNYANAYINIPSVEERDW